MTTYEIGRRREDLRKFMEAHPRTPYGIMQIGELFHIPKHFIDRNKALSYEGSHIERSRTRRRGVRWTYSPSEA
jgi:hypothetical protein